jgi:hypothetical protein
MISTSFCQLGISNITYSVLDSTVEITYDLRGGWEQEYNIVAVTVSEAQGEPFHSITHHITGQMGRLLPGQDKTLTWIAGASASQLKESELRFKIYVSRAPTITQLSTQKRITTNPQVRSKWSWVFVGTFVGSGAYAIHSLTEANKLYDEYSSTSQRGRLDDLKDEIRRKDMYFHVSLGVSAVSAALIYYFAFKYKGKRKLTQFPSKNYSVHFTTGSSTVGLTIQRKF